MRLAKRQTFGLEFIRGLGIELEHLVVAGDDGPGVDPLGQVRGFVAPEVAGDPALGGPDVHCAHAAPDGGGVCVDAEPTLCQTYCDLAEATCTDANAIDFGVEECLTVCGTWTAGEQELDGDDAVIGPAGGDTVACSTCPALRWNDPPPHVRASSRNVNTECGTTMAGAVSTTSGISRAMPGSLASGMPAGKRKDRSTV